MNNQSPFIFVPEDNFNVLNDIKNLYSLIASLQQQLNSIEKNFINAQKGNSPALIKPTPTPLNIESNYPSENYII